MISLSRCSGGGAGLLIVQRVRCCREQSSLCPVVLVNCPSPGDVVLTGDAAEALLVCVRVVDAAEVLAGRLVDEDADLGLGRSASFRGRTLLALGFGDKLDVRDKEPAFCWTTLGGLDEVVSA